LTGRKASFIAHGRIEEAIKLVLRNALRSGVSDSGPEPQSVLRSRFASKGFEITSRKSDELNPLVQVSMMSAVPPFSVARFSFWSTK
jgi:hypothetical protein